MSEFLQQFAEGAGRGASLRSSPGLFDVEVAARPCRSPCDVHVHAEQCPSNFHGLSGLRAEEKPYLNSNPYEVDDDVE